MLHDRVQLFARLQTREASKFWFASCPPQHKTGQVADVACYYRSLTSVTRLIEMQRDCGEWTAAALAEVGWCGAVPRHCPEWVIVPFKANAERRRNIPKQRHRAVLEAVERLMRA